MRKKTKQKTDVPSTERLMAQQAKNGKLQSKQVKKIRKKEDKAKTREKKQNIKNIPKTILDIIPIKKEVDEGETGFELVNNQGFFNLFRILSFDYSSQLDEDSAKHCLIWDKHYRTFLNDEKLIAVNMPIDFSKNIQFDNHKLSKTTNPYYQEVLLDSQYDYTVRLRMRETKDFFLYVYAETYDELVKVNARIKATVCYNGLVQEISFEEKKDVFKKFSNPYNRQNG